jgi:hypothetical protein
MTSISAALDFGIYFRRTRRTIKRHQSATMLDTHGPWLFVRRTIPTMETVPRDYGRRLSNPRELTADSDDNRCLEECLTMS